jgi:serine/threonine protein kinase/tetratricopeptide (TPR) repeat protein
VTPERWQQLKVVFFGAIEREDASERVQYLDATCGDDIDLRQRVQSLLDQPPDEFDSLADEVSLTMPDANAGRRLGAYELTRELGRGGMGAVWLARRADEQFEKVVAIKLLKRGTDTDEVLRRFHTERQILARLEHPNIARLLDGGVTDDDLPYFVMEYVEGVPVTDFCRERALTLEERLRLFLKICGAVQFAHQNLIVHRDLKPANILVTVEGEPKLLDFGIAKLLEADESTLFVTMTEHQRLTPAYASPEQVRGEPITTVSDVYSLGTLLYEILSGQNAHKFSVPHPPPTELFRVVVQEEPVRPSSVVTDGTIARRLRGDLDNIILKALRKEPARRYSGVGSFTVDLQRYLENKPVTARKDTAWYRASKFARRNKLGMAAAVLVLLSLIGGIVMTRQQARQTRRQFQQTRRLAHSVIFDYHDAIARLPGSTAVRRQLVTDSLSYLDGLEKEGVRDHSLALEIALAYVKVGDVQGEPYAANLGDTAGALASYQKAIAMLSGLASTAPADAEVQRDFSLASLKLALLHQRRGAWDEALAVQRKGTAVIERLVASSNPTAANRALLADSYLSEGKALYQGARSPSVEAERAGLARFEQALAVREELVAADPANHELKRKLAAVHSYMGYALWAIGDLTGDRSNYDAALENFEKSYAMTRTVAVTEPTDTPTQRSVSAALADLAEKKALLGNPTAGRDHLLEAREIMRRLADADPDNLEAQRDVAEIDLNLARIYQQLEQLTEARTRCSLALQTLERAQRLDPTSAETARMLADARQRMTALDSAIQ